MPAGGGGGSGLPLEIVAFLAHSHPTNTNYYAMIIPGYGLPLEIVAFLAHSHPTNTNYYAILKMSKAENSYKPRQKSILK